MRALLSLGSNVGDRGAMLRRAVSRLHALLTSPRISQVYVTSPVGTLDQGDFFNMAVSGETALECLAFFRELLSVERALGRVRTVPKGPRTIDLDLIYFDVRCCDTPSLSLPHPARLSRRFVLVPLAEIEPDFMDPVALMKLSELARGPFEASQQVRALGPLADA